MKHFLLTILIMIPFLSGNTMNSTLENETNYKKLNYSIITKKELIEKIAKLESAGKYNIANKYLMVGKYQASRSTLLQFGYSKEKVNEIRNSVYMKRNSKGVPLYYFNTDLFPPLEQERFINWYINQMETIYLKKYIENYSGKIIEGVHITKAGILSASMLGFGHVKKFLRGEDNFSDKFSTSIKNRIKQFENIEIIN
jgi:hypothetical protein